MQHVFGRSTLTHKHCKFFVEKLFSFRYKGRSIKKQQILGKKSKKVLFENKTHGFWCSFMAWERNVY